MNDDTNLSDEERAKIQESLSRASGLLKGVTAGGLLGLAGRAMVRRTRRSVRGRMRRPRMKRRLALLLAGLGVVMLSLLTCSAGVDVNDMVAGYGDPAPASPDAAKLFFEKAGAALKAAPNTGSVRISISEAEAASAIAVGMMVPEVMRARQSMDPEELRAATTIDEMRDILDRHAAGLDGHLAGPSSATSATDQPPGAAASGPAGDQTESIPATASGPAAAQPSTMDKIWAKLDPRLRVRDSRLRFTEAGEVVAAGYVAAWRWRLPVMFVIAPHASAGQLELDFVEGRMGRVPAPEWAFDLLGRGIASIILLGSEYAEITKLSVTDGMLDFEGRLAR